MLEIAKNCRLQISVGNQVMINEAVSLQVGHASACPWINLEEEAIQNCGVL